MSKEECSAYESPGNPNCSSYHFSHSAGPVPWLRWWIRQSYPACIAGKAISSLVARDAGRWRPSLVDTFKVKARPKHMRGCGPLRGWSLRALASWDGERCIVSCPDGGARRLLRLGPREASHNQALPAWLICGIWRTRTYSPRIAYFRARLIRGQLVTSYIAQ